MIIAAFAVVSLLALALAYQYLYVPVANADPFPSSSSVMTAGGGMAWWRARGDEEEEGFSSSEKKKAKLVFLYMNGCGWCEKFSPHWDSFVGTYGDRLAKVGVSVASYERSDPAAKAYSADVQGYPTILLVKDADVVLFKGERTPQGLVTFLQENGFVL